jgi:hypothetical protein
VEQEVLEPAGLDCQRPLLLLEVLGGRLAGLGGLAQEVLRQVGVEGVQHAVEEVPLGQALVLQTALRLRQVLPQLGALREVDHLPVHGLHAELGPPRDRPCRHLVRLEGQLLAAEDVLEVLEPGLLEGRQHEAD